MGVGSEEYCRLITVTYRKLAAPWDLDLPEHCIEGFRIQVLIESERNCPLVDDLSDSLDALLLVISDDVVKNRLPYCSLMSCCN